METILKRKVVSMLMVLAVMLTVFTACDEDDDDPAPSIAAPTLNNASEIANTSFKATWSAVTGAEKYLVEVSTNANFSSTVNGYNKKEVSETSANVTGLTANTKYYFRVYAKKGTAVSAASASKDVTTNNQ